MHLNQGLTLGNNRLEVYLLAIRPMTSAKDKPNSVLSFWSRKYMPFQLTAKTSCVLGRRGPGQKVTQSEGQTGYQEQLPVCSSSITPDVLTRESGDFK